MAKHSKSYIAAGLANKNTNSMYPVFQSWLADKNLGTGITSAMAFCIRNKEVTRINAAQPFMLMVVQIGNTKRET